MVYASLLAPSLALSLSGSQSDSGARGLLSGWVPPAADGGAVASQRSPACAGERHTGEGAVHRVVAWPVCVHGSCRDTWCVGPWRLPALSSPPQSTSCKRHLSVLFPVFRFLFSSVLPSPLVLSSRQMFNTHSVISSAPESDIIVWIRLRNVKEWRWCSFLWVFLTRLSVWTGLLLFLSLSCPPGWEEVKWRRLQRWNTGIKSKVYTFLKRTI